MISDLIILQLMGFRVIYANTVILIRLARSTAFKSVVITINRFSRLSLL